MWRVWIEITKESLKSCWGWRSPSVWRVWIEMVVSKIGIIINVSPSVWRVWIEIYHFEGELLRRASHPPCGGCGLKFC